MSFRDLNIKTEYKTLRDNIVKDFYIPLLNEAITYKRAVGYFNSSILNEIKTGIYSLAKRKGKIYIIASPFLNKDDIKAIEIGYKKRDEIIAEVILRNLESDIDEFSESRLNLLANLIKDEILDIKIAFTVSDNGKNVGMYHEKIGILEDSEGNLVAFSGSMNETHSAVSLNFENVDVFTSWSNDNDNKRVLQKVESFDRIWCSEEKNVEVKSFPELKQLIIDKYLIEEIDYNCDSKELLTEDTYIVPDLTNKLNKIDDEDNNTLVKPDSTEMEIKLKPRVPCIPDYIKLHDYQKEAIQSWVEHGYQGIFDMATGTGKTITGLGAITALSEHLSHNLAVIIVCPYQHLVEQWVEDIKKFNILPIIGHSSSTQKKWKYYLKRDIDINKPFICFICTNATFRNHQIQKEIKRIKNNILLVVDEAHNFGSTNLSALLDDKYKYRLALSATLERHRDEEGTEKLKAFFKNKCIEYTLERAINDGKLTQYEYHPIVVSLDKDELMDYKYLTKEIGKCFIVENGKKKLTKKGEILAIQRARLIAGARIKLSKLKEVIYDYKDDNFILVYCGATSFNKDDDYYFDIQEQKELQNLKDQNERQITDVIKMLGFDLNMNVSPFTSEESMEERKTIIEAFKNGKDLQALVAIKCLDEGVNIPSIKTAFILASTTNPKEYIQRRGRVLRLSPETNKTMAIIYDFITIPRPLNEINLINEEDLEGDISLIKNELSRLKEFGNLSFNPEESLKLYEQISEIYKLDDSFF